MKTRILNIAFTMLSLASYASAGTILTTDLPSGDAIVNISGTNDGASGYDGGQNNWFNPFAQNGQLLTYTVKPGTYTFTIIDPTDASSLFPTLTSGDLSEIYTAWTYNTPWVDEYDVFDANAPANTPELFAGSSSQMVNPGQYAGFIGGGWDNAQDSYNAYKAAGLLDQVWINGRNTGTAQSSFTFTQTTELAFAVPDYDVLDNGGGVSVLISPQAVPEPSSFLGVGLFAGLAMLKRRKRT